MIIGIIGIGGAHGSGGYALPAASNSSYYWLTLATRAWAGAGAETQTHDDTS